MWAPSGVGLFEVEDVQWYLIKSHDLESRVFLEFYSKYKKYSVKIGILVDGSKKGPSLILMCVF